MILNDVFEPARFSNEELAFLAVHLEDTPLVALHDGAPPGVNPAAIMQALTRIQELHQLHVGRNVGWCGFDAIRDSIMRYRDWQIREAEIYRRSGGTQGANGVPHASQYAWDKRGRYFRGGIGADSAEMVRTEILADGSRKRFGVSLLETPGGMREVLEDVAPWLQAQQVSGPPEELAEDWEGEHGNVMCPICRQAETFETSNRSSYLAARRRIAQHLLSAKTDIDRHRALHTVTFK